MFTVSKYYPGLVNLPQCAPEEAGLGEVDGEESVCIHVLQGSIGNPKKLWDCHRSWASNYLIIEALPKKIKNRKILNCPGEGIIIA